jgi:hypothetical protein
MHHEGKVAENEFCHRWEAVIVVSEDNDPDFDRLME